MLPPAPGLFSTTIDWPIPGAIFSAIRREMMSDAPPGGYGTTMRRGLLGNVSLVCAPASAWNAMSSMLTLSVRNLMGCLLKCFPSVDFLGPSICPDAFRHKRVYEDCPE